MPRLTTFYYLFLAKLNYTQKQKCAQHTCKTRKCVLHGLQENKPTAWTQSSSEANRSRGSHEIPQITGTHKNQQCIHKSVPPVPVLSQINPVHAPHPICQRSISHPRLGLVSDLFPSSFLIKTLHTPLLSPICNTCPPISFFFI